MIKRRAFRYSALIAMAVLFCPVGARGAALPSQGAIDYVTVEEEDLIRDAQGLQLRAPLLLKLLLRSNRSPRQWKNLLKFLKKRRRL